MTEKLGAPFATPMGSKKVQDSKLYPFAHSAEGSSMAYDSRLHPAPGEAPSINTDAIKAALAFKGEPELAKISLALVDMVEKLPPDYRAFVIKCMREGRLDAVAREAKKKDDDPDIQKLLESMSVVPPERQREMAATLQDFHDRDMQLVRGLAGTSPFPAEAERDAANEMERVLHGLPQELQMRVINEMSHGALTRDSLRGHIPDEGTGNESDDRRLIVLTGLRPDQQMRVAQAYKGTGHIPPTLLEMARDRLKDMDRRVEKIIPAGEDMERELADINLEKRRLHRRLDDIDVEEMNDKGRRAVLEMHNNPVLQKLTESGLHKLMDAASAGHVSVPHYGGDIPTKMRAVIAELPNYSPQVFVVQHNWGAAFSKADDFKGGEWLLPYRDCVFEFRITGRRVVVVCGGDENAALVSTAFFVDSGAGWLLTCMYDVTPNGDWVPVPEIVALGDDTIKITQPVMELCRAQIRAISISLEAEVATTEVIRAPHKLNQKRERAGKVAIYDYHVVDLSRRKRYETLPRATGEDDIHHRRAHWVRGHWRHYEKSKSWIKWHLRGDLDLGFVDKEYRL